jgi:hypothetical protein
MVTAMLSLLFLALGAAAGAGNRTALSPQWRRLLLLDCR